MSTAADIISDLGNNNSLSDTLKKRSKEAINSVRDQVVNKLQSGSGKFKKGLKRLKSKVKKGKKVIKSKSSQNTTQSCAKHKKRNSNSTKTRVLDIFS